jgi:mitotic spindle assembly checkpoint protein MAD2B
LLKSFALSISYSFDKSAFYEPIYTHIPHLYFIRTQLSRGKGSVSRVAVVVYSPDCQPLERFVFDLSSFPAVPPSEITTPFEDPTSTVSLADLAQQFRGAMQKLAFCGSTLGPLPTNSSFTVCIELKPDGEAPIDQSSTPWIPSQPSLQPNVKGQNQCVSDTTRSSTIGKDLGGVKTKPVRTLEAGAFLLEVWVEEGKAKANSLSDPASG